MVAHQGNAKNASTMNVIQLVSLLLCHTPTQGFLITLQALAALNFTASLYNVPAHVTLLPENFGVFVTLEFTMVLLFVAFYYWITRWGPTCARRVSNIWNSAQGRVGRWGVPRWW